MTFKWLLLLLLLLLWLLLLLLCTQSLGKLLCIFDLLRYIFDSRTEKKHSLLLLFWMMLLLLLLLFCCCGRCPTTVYHAHWEFAFISYASSDRTIGRPDLTNRFSVLEVFAKFLVLLWSRRTLKTFSSITEKCVSVCVCVWSGRDKVRVCVCVFRWRSSGLKNSSFYDANFLSLLLTSRRIEAKYLIRLSFVFSFFLSSQNLKYLTLTVLLT